MFLNSNSLSESLKKRNPSMDIVRIVAVFCVISTHFFLYNDFYKETVGFSASMIIMFIMRSLFGICVPLFIILSGYLMSKKTLSKRYYSGIKKTLVVYVLASIACLIYKMIKQKATYTVSTFILSILDFTAAPYAWYIEMYIGLFLLIPFLNILYNNLETKKKKQILILTFIALAVLPTIFNIWNFETVQWWASPITSTKYAKLIPSFWLTLYPITYYFVGCYLKEYGLKIKSSTAAVLFAVLTVSFALLHFWRSFGGKYETGLYGYWYGVEPFILSVLLFTLLSRIKLNNASNGVKWVLWKVSDLTLSMFLVSYIFDSWIYPELNSNVTVMQERLPFYFVTVPLIFIDSLLLSIAINFLSKLILKFISALPAIIEKLRKQKLLTPQNVTFLVLFLSALVFAFWKCKYGFGGNDEAFYLTIPHRLLMGDALFADEWHLSQLSGVLLMPFVALFQIFTGSTIGIMLAARVCYVIFHSAVAVFIYVKLRKYGFASIIASLMYFIFTPYDIMTYSYNTMAIDLIVVTGLLMLQENSNRKVPFVLAGITYAASVLCCPYFAVCYVIYFIFAVIKRFALKSDKNKLSNDESILDLKIFLKFTIGVVSLAAVFLAFLLSRTSVSDIIANLPLMLKDPEHSGISVWSKILSYFTSIYNCHEYFKFAIIAFGIQLVVMAIDKRRSNHRAAYLAVSSVIALFALVLFIPKMKYLTYNYIMFPVVFIGITSYILCDNKPKRLMAALFIPSVIYSLAIHLGSNQMFFVISMAFSVVNIASIIFAGQLICELKERPDDICYDVLMRKTAVCFFAAAVAVLGICQVKIKAEHCFWESGAAKDLPYKIMGGPAKGLYTSKENGNQYNEIYTDIKQYFKSNTRGNTLMLTEKTWCYLALNDYPYGTFSAWISGENDVSIERLYEFYKINPAKDPIYVYIPKSSKWDLKGLNNNANEKGFTVKENESSYILEKKK